MGPPFADAYTHHIAVQTHEINCGVFSRVDKPAADAEILVETAARVQFSAA
jgi:hypothetical protein